MLFRYEVFSGSNPITASERRFGVLTPAQV